MCECNQNATRIEITYCPSDLQNSFSFNMLARELRSLFIRCFFINVIEIRDSLVVAYTGQQLSHHVALRIGLSF
jgi:hypothetical protein